MKRIILLTFLAIVVALGGCGGGGENATEGGKTTAGEAPQENTALEADYAALREKTKGDMSDEEYVAAGKEFLAKYPESGHTMNILGDIVWIQSNRLEDREGAVRYAEEIRSRVTDEELALRLDRRLINWYGEAKMKDKMVALAEHFDEEGIARFGDYFNVVEKAIEMEEWAMARAWCRKGEPKANGETWREEWPDQESTEEQMERAGLNRKAMLQLNDSWARANLGEIEEALEGFADASEIVSRNYVGVAGYSLDSYWGKTLLMSGDPESAIEKFAPAALIAHSEEATEDLQRAFTAINGTSSGYDAWAGRYLASIAKAYDDFTLPDTSGVERRFSDLRGRVTMLNFWSPT